MANNAHGKKKGPQASATAPQPAIAPAQANEEAEDWKMKKSALYEATYQAWVNTNFEADKTIITIASGGIGLLVTLLNVIEAKSDTDIYWYIAAIATFIIAIAAGIFIFKRNSVVLTKSLNKNYEKDRWLGIADTLMLVSFALGLLLTSYIGLKASVNKLAKAAVETKANNESRNNQPNQVNIRSLTVDTLTVRHINYSSAKPKKRR